MSSIDLAKLCLGESKDAHSNFVIKAKKVIGVGALLNFQERETYGNNNTRITYNLPEREACLMAMSYSYELQAKVYDEWQSLKLKNNLPDFTNPAIAARAWADEVEARQLAIEQKEVALVEVDRLQGVCNTITAQFKHGITPNKFALQLRGVNVQKVNTTLVSLGKLRHVDNGYMPTSISRDDLFKANFGDHGQYATVTLKGAKWLYRLYLSNKLPMKKTWDGSFDHLVFEV